MRSLTLTTPTLVIAAFLTAALFMTGARPAAAAVAVTFNQPDSYTDVGDRYRDAPNPRLLRELSSYFQEMGEKYLQGGQVLTVEVLDIDRAGRIDPWIGRGDGPRVMDEIAWPRITLRYELREGGRLVAGAQEILRDQGYLTHARAGSNDDLRYEKKMIEDWFTVRFARAAVAH